jgi:hypothetical protein
LSLSSFGAVVDQVVRALHLLRVVVEVVGLTTQFSLNLPILGVLFLIQSALAVTVKLLQLHPVTVVGHLLSP